MKSLAERIADLPAAAQELLFDQAQLTDAEAEAILRSWRFSARPEQLLPDPAVVGAYHVLAWVTGRAFGKTRSATSAFHERVRWMSEQPRAVRTRQGIGAIVHRTAGDVRDVCIDGPDGLLATAPRGWRPSVNKSTGVLEWPNGYKAYSFSAETPDKLRGPTISVAHAEEFATWKGERDATGATAWDNLQAAMRGADPLVLLTTTPKRTKAMRELEARAAVPASGVLLVRGSMLDNYRNLPPEFVQNLVEKFGNSALGQQEIAGLLANDVEGAAFRSKWFDDSRLPDDDSYLPMLGRTIIAVDPNTTDAGDECGIVVLAESASRLPDGRHHVYALDDVTVPGGPEAWVPRVVQAAEFYGAHFALIEQNQGGQAWRMLFRNAAPWLRVREVNAVKDKMTRALAVSGFVSAGQVHLVGEDAFVDLEAQCCTWTRTDRYSPDRMDAFVHGLQFFAPKLNRKAV